MGIMGGMSQLGPQSKTMRPYNMQPVFPSTLGQRETLLLELHESTSPQFGKDLSCLVHRDSQLPGETLHSSTRLVGFTFVQVLQRVFVQNPIGSVRERR
jgi:hypothetical protein